MELLQHDADVASAKAIAGGRRERGEILPGDEDAAAGGQQQSRDEVEQRRLPAAGRADDEHVVRRRKFEHVELQDVVASAVAEPKIFDANHRAALAFVLPHRVIEHRL